MATDTFRADSVLANLPPHFAPMPAVMRTLAQFDRRKLEGFITVAIGLLDVLDGDTDVELNGDEADGTAGEDDFYPHSNWQESPGCPIADPGGCEHDGHEPDQDAEPETWSSWMDHPAELHVGHRPGHTEPAKN